jgi:4-hydroxy-4-methyl-2-oxoglutarate aldolase
MSSDSEISRRLVQLGVAALHESSGRRNLHRGLWLIIGEPFAGRAVTVELPAGDNLGVHLALEAAGHGSVVCIASAGRGLYGVVGDLLVEAGRARGIAGFVIDDGIRDVVDLAPPPAIAARGISALGTVKRRLRRRVGADVSLGGVLVAAGDWIVCDRDGVCTVAKHDLDEVVARAELRVEREDELRGRLRRGTTSRSALGLPSDAPPSIR